MENIMAATYDQVQEWIVDGKSNGATHLISVCDTFGWDDYPVYVYPEDDLKEVMAAYSGVRMQTINEVIELIEDGDT